MSSLLDTTQVNTWHK